MFLDSNLFIAVLIDLVLLPLAFNKSTRYAENLRALWSTGSI